MAPWGAETGLTGDRRQVPSPSPILAERGGILAREEGLV